MNTKFLLSPAYLVSVAALIVGAILASTRWMVLGWMIFIIGLALNAMALVVLANREYLRRAQRVGTVPKASAHAPTGVIEDKDDAAAAAPAGTEEPAPQAAPKKRSGKITDSHSIFPHKKS